MLQLIIILQISSLTRVELWSKLPDTFEYCNKDSTSSPKHIFPVLLLGTVNYGKGLVKYFLNSESVV